MIDAATCLLDRAALERACRRLAHEIRENHIGTQSLVLAGVERGGIPLARVVATHLLSLGDPSFGLATIDVTGHRDDRPRSPGLASWSGFEGAPGGPPPVNGATVILIDDVIHTGRTLRAALDALAACGRPASVELAVLIDRGRREFPLRATYVGKNIPAPADDWVDVRIDEGAFLIPRQAAEASR